MTRLSLILSFCGTALVLALVASGCGDGEDETAQVEVAAPEEEMLAADEAVALSLEVTSTVLPEGELFPKRYTCDGKDLSPPLKWSGVPEGTKSIALILDDPDALGRTFVHWVLYGIPSDVTELEEGVPATEVLPNGARQGVNDFENLGYGGPCPPGAAGKVHGWVFKVYALDHRCGPGLGSHQVRPARHHERPYAGQG